MTNRVQAPNLAQMFLWVYKTNLEGVPRDPNFGGVGGIARSSISVDLFQHGNEADEFYVPLYASLPQKLRQTLAQMFLWA